MANKGNGLPPKLYKKMLTESYLQTLKDGYSIKNYLGKNQDPILQKEDRYIPPRTKGNVLTEEYIRKMAEKPEKDHIKRIPMENNLTSGVKVVTETKKKEGIKMNPNIRRNEDSMKSYENYKHLKTYKKPDTLKHFYYDAFNSFKQNQLDLAKNRANVSIKIINNYFNIFQRRYLNKPKDNVIIPPEPIAKQDPDKFSYTYSGGFKRPLPPKTYDRIFNADKKAREFNAEQESKKGRIRRNNQAYRDSIGNMFEEQGKISREQKISEKPCNDNYRVLSNEAKKNLTERYYYDSYMNQW